MKAKHGHLPGIGADARRYPIRINPSNLVLSENVIHPNFIVHEIRMN